MKRKKKRFKKRGKKKLKEDNDNKMENIKRNKLPSINYITNNDNKFGININREGKNPIYINQSFKFVEGSGYNENTLLIDLKKNAIGQLNALNFATDKIINANNIDNILKIFSKVYKDVRLNPENEVNWIKLLVLPKILFAYGKDDSKSLNNRVKERIEFLLNDNWDYFTLKFIGFKDIQITYNEEKLEKKKQDSVKKLVQDGNLSKAMKKLNSVNIHTEINNIDEHNRSCEERVIAANKKFIQEIKDNHPSQEKMDMFHSKNVLKNKVFDKLSIDVGSIIEMIKISKKGVAAGADGLSNEILKKLFQPYNNNPSPNMVAFREEYTYFLNNFLENNIPEFVLDYFRDSVLYLIPKEKKKDNDKVDVRPIAVGLTTTKLIMKSALKNVNMSKIDKIFGGMQKGLKKRGTEEIIFALQVNKDKYPEKDMFIMDAENGYGNLNAYAALEIILKELPEIYNVVKNLLMPGNKGSNSYVMGNEDGIKPILRLNGIPQGNSGSGFLYSIGITTMLNELNKILNGSSDPNIVGENLILFFLDDGYLSFDNEKLEEVLKCIENIGSNIGYIINKKKGSYLLGFCNSYTEAIKRKEIVIKLGINKDIIKINPKDMFIGFRENYISKEELNNAINEYSVKCLGSYIGLEESIKIELKKKSIQLQIEKDKLLQLQDNQCRQLLMTYCFANKCMYLARTLSPNITEEIFEDNYKYQNELVHSLLLSVPEQNSINKINNLSRLKNIAILPPDLRKISYIAYAASVAENSVLIDNHNKGFINDINDDNNNADFYNSSQKLYNYVEDDDNSIISSITDDFENLNNSNNNMHGNEVEEFNILIDTDIDDDNNTTNKDSSLNSTIIDNFGHSKDSYNDIHNYCDTYDENININDDNSNNSINYDERRDSNNIQVNISPSINDNIDDTQNDFGNDNKDFIQNILNQLNQYSVANNFKMALKKSSLLIDQKLDVNIILDLQNKKGNIINQQDDQIIGGGKIQKILSQMYLDQEKKIFMKNLIDSNDKELIAWIISASDNSAGLIFKTIPSDPNLKISNTEWSYILHRWLLIPIPGAKSKRCSCGKYIDDHGFHITNLAGCNGHRIEIHDHVLNEIYKMCRTLGNFAKKEQLSNIDNNCRCDIVLIDQKIQFDVTIIATINAKTKFTSIDKIFQEEISNTAFNKKLIKYSIHTLINDNKVIPIVFENTGKLHSAGKKIIKDLIYNSYNDKLSAEIMYIYWLKRINVCLMKQNAIAIYNRIKILKEDKIHKNDPAHSILTEGIRINYQK